MGLGERIGVATAHHLPVVGEHARGEVFEVLAVRRVEHGVEGIGHGGAEGHIGVAALRHDVEIVVAVGVDARDGAGTVSGGDHGGGVGAVGAVVALAAVFDIDRRGAVERRPAYLNGGGRGGELDIRDAAAAHIDVVDIIDITCVDRFKAERDILPCAGVRGKVDAELLPPGGVVEPESGNGGVGGSVVGVVHHAHLQGVGAGGVAVHRVGVEGHHRLGGGAFLQRRKGEEAGGVGGGVEGDAPLAAVVVGGGEGGIEVRRADDAPVAGREVEGVVRLVRLAIGDLEIVCLGGDDDAGAAAPAAATGAAAAGASTAPPAAAGGGAGTAAAGQVSGADDLAVAKGLEVKLVFGQLAQAVDGGGAGEERVEGAVAVGEAPGAVFDDDALRAVACPADGDGILRDVGDGEVGRDALLDAEVVEVALAPVAVGGEQLEGDDVAAARVGGEREGVMLPVGIVAHQGVDTHEAVGVEDVRHHAHHQPGGGGIAFEACPEVGIQPAHGHTTVGGVNRRHGGKTVEAVDSVELHGVALAVPYVGGGAWIVAADGGESAPVVGEAVGTYPVEVGAVGDIDPCVEGLFAEGFVVAVVGGAVALWPEVDLEGGGLGETGDVDGGGGVVCGCTLAGGTVAVGHPNTGSGGGGVPYHVDAVLSEAAEAAVGDGTVAEGEVVDVCPAAAAVGGAVAEGDVAAAAVVGGEAPLDACPAAGGAHSVEGCEGVGVARVGHHADDEGGVGVFVVVVEVHLQA